MKHIVILLIISLSIHYEDAGSPEDNKPNSKLVNIWKKTFGATVVAEKLRCVKNHGEFRNCGANCMKTCADPTKENVGKVCERCKPGCHCKKDYFKLVNGTCVQLKDCPVLHD